MFTVFLSRFNFPGFFLSICLRCTDAMYVRVRVRAYVSCVKEEVLPLVQLPVEGISILNPIFGLTLKAGLGCTVHLTSQGGLAGSVRQVSTRRSPALKFASAPRSRTFSGAKRTGKDTLASARPPVERMQRGRSENIGMIHIEQRGCNEGEVKTVG